MLTVICAALALSAAPSMPPSDEVDILYFSPSGPRLLRLHLRIDGQPYRQKFDALINRIFDECDRNRDGVIDAKEAARLPNFGGRGNLSVNFVGRIRMTTPTPPAPKENLTRAGLESHYAAAGIVPFQVGGATGGYSVAGARTPAQITARVFKLLDTNGDGKLSAAELAAAERKLLKFDADDDELVGLDELLDEPSAPAGDGEVFVVGTAGAPGVVAIDFIALTDPLSAFEALRRLKAARREMPTRPDAEITVNLKSESGEVSATAGRLATGVKLRKDGANAALEIGNAVLTLGASSGDGGVFFTTLNAAEQYKELFKQADADKNGYIDRKEAAGVPFFAANFAAIDADGDGMIFEKEVTAHVKKMIELQAGVKAATMSLSVSESGQGLFDLFDLNRDGVLSVREMRRAPEVLKKLGVKTLAPADVPRQLHAGFAAGGGNDLGYGDLVAVSFLRSGMATPALPASKKGPEWFRRMDRNGDADVSRSEWLGTKAEFDRADADGDGLLSLEEAEAYEKRARRKAAE